MRFALILGLIAPMAAWAADPFNLVINAQAHVPFGIGVQAHPSQAECEAAKAALSANDQARATCVKAP